MSAPARVCLVTGAGSGLGMETALHLAKNGRRVFGSVLTEEEGSRLRSAAQQAGVSIEVVTFDVTDEDAVRRAVDRIAEQAGLDELVHFAGIGLRGFIEDLEMDEIRRVFDINAFGSMHVARAAIPHMRKRRSGRMILTTSIAGRMASMSIGGYASSKFAVEGFAEALHQELYPFGVYVSILEPGLIATPHFTVHRNRGKRAVDPNSPYYSWFTRHEALVDGILARQSFTAADVAEVVRKALDSRRPRLRYVVGRKANLVLSLRRHIPGELFERIYWSFARKIVTGKPPAPLSGLPADPPSAPSPDGEAS